MLASILLLLVVHGYVGFAHFYLGSNKRKIWPVTAELVSE